MPQTRFEEPELDDRAGARDEREVFVFPASFAQRRLWLLHQLEPESPFYNIPTVLRLEGALHVEALQRTLDEIIRRHEVLRTTFSLVDGDPAQIIHPELSVPIRVEDLTNVPAGGRESEALRRVAEEVWRPFDLESGPLLRAALLRLGDADHIAVLTMHHVVSDAWSRTALVGEVAALYEAFRHGRPSPLAGLAIQYADYAEWQRQWLTGERLERQLSYWREQLAGAPPALHLPTDRPRPAVQSHRGATQAVNLPPRLAGALKDLSRREGATLFMTLMAGFKALLYRYTGQEDIVVGTPIAGRSQPETERLIGFFVNTLVLRTRLAGETGFAELVRRVREVALGAFAHQDLPFEKLVEELQPERSLSHTPLFQVAFTFQSGPAPEASLSGLRLSVPYIENTTAKFDLTLLATETDAGINCSLEYNTDLFDDATIARMLAHLANLLEAAAVDPVRPVGDLPMLGDDERRQLLVEWNSTATDYPRRCVHELFEEQAALAPDAPALAFEGESLSYRELNERANRLAHRLRALGVGPEAAVGVLMERSTELVVALLAVLKAGGVYVPLSTAYPKERLALIIEDASPRALLTQERLAASLPAHEAAVLHLDARETNLDAESVENPVCLTTPAHRAYVMYTSGSTGRPKGVSVEHRSIVRLVKETNFADFSSRQVFLLFAPVTFDASTLEIWGGLLNGGRVAVMPPGPATPEELGDALRRHGVTTLWLTAGLFHLMVDENLEGLRPVRQLLAGGDVLSPAHVAKTLRELPECRVINGYGPTENTTFTCCHPVRAGDPVGPSVPVGRPIANTRVYLVSPRMQLAPVGVPGELLAAGDGLARGYLNDPALTAERFIPDPFSAEPGGRLYRTGDLARRLPDGTIEFLGRVDQQVKLRGFRIEPGEIEAHLESHPGVRRCVVIVREDARGEKQLVAYVAAHDAVGGLGADALREYLAAKLPDYMIPAVFVVTDELPLTANGKVDRLALPEPGAGTERPYRAPETPVEELLCGVFAEVLGLRRVGADDNFFHLGGHSLSATRVVSRVRAAAGAGVSLRDLFEAPTPSLLARRVGRAGGAAEAGPPLVARARGEGEALPLSFAQQRLWFFEQLEPGSASYNIPIALRLIGRLNVAALESSLGEVVRRHETLRTSFPLVEGTPAQVVGEPREWRLLLFDLSAMPEPGREAELLAAQEALRPFDLERGPLLRASLLRLAEEEHVLLLSMHHIISDGWSMGVLVREAAALYEAYSEGRESPLEELPIQYADFARWQRQWLTGETLQSQLDYWRAQLGGAAPALELPADHARPATPSYKGAMESLALPSDVAESLRAFSRGESVTLFMTLLAAFKALLHRYTGQEDIVVGTPVAGRTRAEIEPLIGFFVNTLALRTDLSGDPTFRELLRRVREVALGAYAHQDVPFEKLVEELHPERDAGRAPLIRAMFVLQNTPQEILELPGLTLSRLPTAKSMAEFDWVLNAQETEQGLFISFEYNTDLFDAATIRRLLEQLKILLAGAVARPELRVSDLPLLTDLEKRQLLVEWDRSAVSPEGRSVHGLFEEQAARAPDAVAVSFDGGQISYRELDERANQIAHGLREVGVRPGRPVAVMLDSGPEQVMALLGALKVGAHFVCLDPHYPAARLRQMLQEVEPPCLVADESFLGQHAELLAEFRGEQSGRVLALGRPGQAAEGEAGDAERARWFETCPRNAPAVEVNPDDLAYVVYTSGSTGRPKGIMQTHESLCQYVEWQARRFGIAPGKRVAQWASITYDAAYAEIFGALCRGATLCMTGALTRTDPRPLADWLRDERVSLLITVPSFARQVLEILEAAPGAHPLPQMESLLLAGEPLPVSLAEAWLRRFPQGPRLFNLYGPTELVLATCYPVDSVSAAQRSVPVGGAIDGRHVLILDRHGKLAPVGGKGEIYLRSRYLARGYLRQPEATERAFVQNPLHDGYAERVYRTGDFGRWLPDGSVELFGRGDNQVKVRGMRVELEDIEAALLRHEGVAECVVAAHDYGPADRRLCAYVVARGAHAGFELRSFLKGTLPDYMIPAGFVTLDALPRLPNGKVDRGALHAPDIRRPEMESRYAAPETKTELTVAAVWQELLRVERVGRHDNFFDLGGHSLLATQVVNKLRNLCAVELPLRDFFDHPTVAGLAGRIEAARREPEGDDGGLARLLEQVKGMSDEEVQALLAQPAPRAAGRPE